MDVTQALLGVELLGEKGAQVLLDQRVGEADDDVFLVGVAEAVAVSDDARAGLELFQELRQQAAVERL